MHLSSAVLVFFSLVLPGWCFRLWLFFFFLEAIEAKKYLFFPPPSLPLFLNEVRNVFFFLLLFSLGKGGGLGRNYERLSSIF